VLDRARRRRAGLDHGRRSDRPGAGLRLLGVLDEPTVVALPDAHGVATAEDGVRAIQRELVASCEHVVGRIALVDPPPGLDPQGVLDWRTRSRIDSPAAAAYYPWIEVSDPSFGAAVAIPPCGHVAGMWARVDGRVGPHRAPTAETLLAADDAPAGLTGVQQHHLNRAGLNCLRGWPGPDLRAWGPCTLSTDPELRQPRRLTPCSPRVSHRGLGIRGVDAVADNSRLTALRPMREAHQQGRRRPPSGWDWG